MLIDQSPQGAPQGTIVTVEDLFRHVPARLKFLKTPGTEAAHIADLINAYALAHPALRLALVSDERLTFQAPGTGNLFDALLKVFGVEIANQMIAIGDWKSQVAPPNLGDDNLEIPSNFQPPTSDIRLAGYVSPPSVNRSTRKYMFFFVNHRWVQDRTLQHAVIEAYHTALMVGRAPIVVLDVQVPPDMVDVNVHPTKSEVRFRDPRALFRAVQKNVRAALVGNAPIPSVNLGASDASHDFPAQSATQLAINLYRPLPDSVAATPTVQFPNSDFQTPTPKLPMLRVLGQILSMYIIAEGPDGLYLIDQHSAHERVLYEQLMAERAGATVASQELIDPLALPLTSAQQAALGEHRAALASVGFRFEEFGGQTILLRAIPAAMHQSDPRDTLARILDELEQGEAPLEKSAEARLITSVCKSIAVKGGQVLSLEEMRELVRRLEQTTAPRTCPHGRPTMIQLNLGMLEREFGRK